MMFMLVCRKEIKGNFDKINELKANACAEEEITALDTKVESAESAFIGAQRRCRLNDASAESECCGFDVERFFLLALYEKTSQMACNLMVVSQIMEEARVNPAAVFSRLVAYLKQSALDLKQDVEEERQRIVALELPLREYLDDKEGIKVRTDIAFLRSYVFRLRTESRRRKYLRTFTAPA